MLSRNNDDTALLAEWTGVITSLPTGRIVFYQVEFRDTGAGEAADIQVNDDDTTVLFIGPRNTAASIFNVRSAQGYEVLFICTLYINYIHQTGRDFPQHLHEYIYMSTCTCTCT